MPAYDYRCSECGHRFEVQRAFSDASHVRCPVCDGSARRVFTPVGVVFKGSGFHNTDYRPRPATEPSAGSGRPCSDAGDKGACSSCPAAGPVSPS